MSEMGSAPRRIHLLKIPRQLRNLLRGSFNNSPPQSRPWQETYRSIVWLTRFFYAFGLLFAFFTIEDIYQIKATDTIDGLWPVFWITSSNLDVAKNVLIFGLAGSAFLVNFFYGHVLPRLLFFVFVLQGVALINSFGAINHDSHFMIWVSFCFCLLPSMREGSPISKSQVAWAIAIFSFTQILICLFYTLSGLFKAKGGFVVAVGGVSSFAPDALAYLVAERIGKMRNASLLAPLLIGSPRLGWPAHLFVIYFEVFAIVAVFRPRLHRIFGLSAAFFHFMVWFVLGISFYYQAFIVAFLFACSPFYPKSVNWRDVFLDLPLFGDAWRLLTLRRKTAVTAISGKLD